MDDPSKQDGSALFGAIFRGVAIGLIIVLFLVIIGAPAFAPPLPANHPLDTECDAGVPELPQETPAAIVFQVLDDHGRPVDLNNGRYGMTLDAVAQEFPFYSRIHFNAEPDTIGHVHVATIQLFTESLFEPARPPASPPDGRVCGNGVLIHVPQDPDFLHFILVHELGHYFGLPHLDGTWMLQGNQNRSPETNRFAPCQIEILEQWNQPGTPYIPHWERTGCRNSH